MAAAVALNVNAEPVLHRFEGCGSVERGVKRPQLFSEGGKLIGAEEGLVLAAKRARADSDLAYTQLPSQ
jgi:hypothetical protein